MAKKKQDNPRIYTGSDVNMLTACDTIMSHAIKNKVFLISKRTTWADPFFTDITDRIDNAFQVHLGVDSAKDMRLATQLTVGLQKQALPLLAEFKVQIVNDFPKSRSSEILTELGFTSYLKAAQQKDQEALVNLLYQFKLNMIPTLTTEITTEGTDLTTITAITGFADTIKNSNVSQEALKGGRKTITASGVKEFNEIYTSTTKVGKISAKFFIAQPDTAVLFSYTKTVKLLTATGKKPTQPPAQPPANG